MANPAVRKRSNLRDVARQAGVSVATVSRVLNSPAIVARETRERVQQAIEHLHFVPSAAARAINTGRTKMVGALVPTLDNAIFARFLSALENRLGQHGLSLVVATTDGDTDIEACKAQALVDVGVEALIVSGVTHSHAFNALVARTRLPVVITSYYDAGSALPTIGYDNAMAARLALEHLLTLGHRTIAVFHGSRTNNDRTRARLTGLQTTKPGVQLQYFESEMSMAGGIAALRRYLTSGQTASAVLCLSDVLAMSILFECQRQGIDIPEDLSLVGVDDLPSSSYTVPAITSVHLPVDSMGNSTADAVASWLDTDCVPDSLQLASRLEIRQSTRAIAT